MTAIEPQIIDKDTLNKIFPTHALAGANTSNLSKSGLISKINAFVTTRASSGLKEGRIFLTLDTTKPESKALVPDIAWLLKRAGYKVTVEQMPNAGQTSVVFAIIIDWKG